MAKKYFIKHFMKFTISQIKTALAVFGYKLPGDWVQDQQPGLPWARGVHIQPARHRSAGVQLVLLSQGRLQCAYFRYRVFAGNLQK